MHLKFSQDIKLLLEKLAHQPLTLADVVAETSHRGFILMIALLALPFLFPMPPGFTGILGTGCLLLSLQVAVGRKTPWLPKTIAKFTFPHWFINNLLKNIQKATQYLEKLVRPRLLGLAEHPLTWRINGLVLAWLSLLLLLPIPLTNPIPTFGILLLVIATLESDGLMMCVGYGFTTAVTLFFGFVGQSFWQVVVNLFQSVVG